MRESELLAPQRRGLRRMQPNTASDDICTPSSRERDYGAQLALFKEGIRSGDERLKRAEMVANAVSTSSVSILDVGCGAGNATKRTVSALRGRKVSASLVTGLDPVPENRRRFIDGFDKRGAFIQSTLQALKPWKQYDVVCATHSLYYTGELKEALDKLLKLTRPGGLVVITLWSDDCGIRQLSEQLGKCTPTAEAVVTAASSHQEVAAVSIEYAQSPIRPEKWLFSSRALRAAHWIISRSSTRPSLKDASELARLIYQGQYNRFRKNGVVLLKKSAFEAPSLPKSKSSVFSEPLLLLGAPGSGKGTHAAQLSSRFGATVISIDEIKAGKGDRSFIKEVKRALRAVDPSRGIILDSVVRNRRQAELLDKLLEREGYRTPRVVELDIRSDVGAKRLGSERKGPDIGKTLRRRREFERTIIEIRQHYAKSGRLVSVDASGDVRTVSQNVAQILEAPENQSIVSDQFLNQTREEA